MLDRYPPPERPLGPPIPLGGGGGLSGSRLWRYTSPHGERVLRAWPPATSSPERVVRVHAWLAAAADLAFVARPLTTHDDATVVVFDGRCWELTPWLPGEPGSSKSPTSERVRAVFGGLAELHVRLARVEGRRGPSPGLNARLGELKWLISGGFDALASKLATNRDDRCSPPALAWLELARMVAPRVSTSAAAVSRRILPLQPSLRDARTEHFLFAGDVLTGLIDFGAMDVESAAGDLARLMGEWLPGGEFEPLRSDGLAAYQAIRPLAAEELAAASAFEELADVLIAERWIRWRFVEGRRFDDDRAFDEGIARGSARLHKLAARIGPEA
ncbi:phosphotransferase [Paludisphaera mucosa]|uniref:Phosphotransferase n=1 Tax=Paludisphaera mucosa TaxID=3030827 RepID=A0ABT6F5D4_9BACT|nr:phosphotransferase [Paludisphaera mucosa]MDG3002790.1 phosphotransferase [Paludisphaera mucosa]